MEASADADELYLLKMCSIGVHSERAAASTRVLHADADVRPLLNYQPGGSRFELW